MTDVSAGQGTLLGETSTPATTQAETTNTSTSAAAVPEDPRGERNRTWSVEVLLRCGRSERETVKAPSRELTYAYDFTTTPATLIVEGSGALLRIATTEITMVRVSKGA